MSDKPTHATESVEHPLCQYVDTLCGIPPDGGEHWIDNVKPTCERCRALRLARVFVETFAKAAIDDDVSAAGDKLRGMHLVSACVIAQDDELAKLRARLNPTLEQHDANPAQYWADRELEVDERGHRVPRLADCDLPKHHLRLALAELSKSWTCPRCGRSDLTIAGVSVHTTSCMSRTDDEQRIDELRAALREALDAAGELDGYGQWDYDSKIAARVRIATRISELRRLANGG